MWGEDGAATRTRTADLMITNYHQHLSHSSLRLFKLPEILCKVLNIKYFYDSMIFEYLLSDLRQFEASTLLLPTYMQQGAYLKINQLFTPTPAK